MVNSTTTSLNNERVAQHYDHFLGPHYEWMAGDFDAGVDANRTYFDAVEFDVSDQGRAVDLGCGHGFQTIALAQRGFQVLAIDQCETLLQRLRQRKEGHAISVIQADLMDFARHLSCPIDGLVCMGDTLTHLPSTGHIQSLFADAAGAVAPGGRFCLTFRDYSRELKGTERFIPVRSDADRIQTCFLEFHQEKVEVTDLMYHRTEAGWQQSVSSYPKLRLDPAWVVEQCERRGFVLENRRMEAGQCKLLFRR